MKRATFTIAFLWLVVMGAVLGSYPVSAQATDTLTPSITPTITVTAPILGTLVNSTTYPTLSGFACPGGMPSNWGTTTPGPLWLALCGECLGVGTQTPTGIATNATPVYQTATAFQSTLVASTASALALTGTSAALTATSTVTASPTVASYANFKITGWIISYGSGGYGSATASCVPALGTWASLYTCSLDVYNISGGGAGGWVEWSAGIVTQSGSSLYIYFISSTNSSSLVHAYQQHGGDNRGYCDSGHINAQNRVNSYGINMVPSGSEYWANEKCTGTGHTYYVVQMSSYSAVMATPTIVPTSVAGSYCSTVSGSGDNGFSWTGIGYGDIACVDIGPVDWSTVLPSWMPTGGLPTVPWIAHICFQNIDIGVITVFAMSFSLSNFAYVMGAVGVIMVLVSK